MRALAVGLTMAAALVLAGPASAASTLYIRGGGYGHGIGMSQYGAYGYALNGWSYQQILAHYYTSTALGQTSPNQMVRVLLGLRRSPARPRPVASTWTRASPTTSSRWPTGSLGWSTRAPTSRWASSTRPLQPPALGR